MKKESVWSLFRRLVNSKPLGAIITRQEIIEYLKQNNFVTEKLRNETTNLYSEATLDSARNMAEKVGYLCKTAQLGVYEVACHFPPEYTVSQLRKDYDNGRNCND